MPLVYTVKYRQFSDNSAWRILENVVADGIAEHLAYRFFITTTGERYEIPAQDTEFHFSKERGELISANVEAAKKAAEEQERGAML